MSKDYKVGDIVWAKLRGHPWWPSRIEDEEYIPEIVLKQKPRNGNVIPVFFFGSRDYGWFASETLKPFEQHKKDFIKKKNTVLFDKAVQQAMDPTILEKEIEREKAEYEEEEEEEEEEQEEEEEEEQEEEEEEEEEEEKPVKKSSKRSRPTTQKSENSRKRRKEEQNNTKSSSKKRNNVAAPSESLTSESEETNAKEEQKKEEIKKDNGEKKKSEENQKRKDHKHKRHGGSILKTRVKIQKLLTADFEDDHIRQKASDLLKEADTFNMTLDILRETKIGKVVKKFSQLPIKDDSLNLIHRANGLLLKWKSVVTPHQHVSNSNAKQVETTTSSTEQHHNESQNKPKEKPTTTTSANTTTNAATTETTVTPTAASPKKESSKTNEKKSEETVKKVEEKKPEEKSSEEKKEEKATEEIKQKQNETAKKD